MIVKQEYIEYLLSTPFNYTCTNMADHKPNLSHDVVSDFLRRERFTPADLWAIVQPYITDSVTASVLVDDSVQDKRYSHFIELVKKQYSGNEHGTVKGIGLVNFVHTAGNDEPHWPIDYRIFHPETDGKTKNDHFQEMFKRLITHKHLKARRILFDSWYASVDNLRLIHRAEWTFFTTLKSNRLVSLHRDTGYQHLDTLGFTEQTLITGLLVKLKEIPFKVKLFKLVAPNGDIDWVITNDLDVSVNRFVAELANDTRWQIETFHRSFKQLTGSERCQCRKARSQRNHLACCYQAWVALQVKANQVGQTIYQLRTGLFSDYLRHELANPRIQAITL
ncbi:IS701 family transposase [Spirosoma panaciterrae]|uniref:IS701 family transposase n=1 Tax=Spirosoma panaciterrae TaxID=496058 RepID=UPI00039DBD16|nr:transposase [Spirosoma panaciterrae]